MQILNGWGPIVTCNNVLFSDFLIESVSAIFLEIEIEILNRWGRIVFLICNNVLWTGNLTFISILCHCSIFYIFFMSNSTKSLLQGPTLTHAMLFMLF